MILNVTSKIDVSSASEVLRRKVAGLKGTRLRKLNAAMGYEVQHLTAEYLRILSGSRHGTALRLGATPSGHLARAAEQVAQPDALESGAEFAEITITTPGMTRAFRDLKIVPRKAKMLTIPLVAAAYNRRAPEIPGLTVIKQRGQLFLFLPEPGSQATYTKRHYTGKQDKDGRDEYQTYKEKGALRGVVMYLLLRSVTLKQDRSLLPTDEMWQEAATLGAAQYIRKL